MSDRSDVYLLIRIFIFILCCFGSVVGTAAFFAYYVPAG